VNLPRVVVTVVERVGGWTVDVREWKAAAPLVPVFDLDEVTVEFDGVDVRVPVFPRTRPVGSDGPHGPLCRGDTAAIQNLLSRLVTRSGVTGDATAYGRWLFDCLLGPAWEAIGALPAVAAARPRPGVEIALRWSVTETGLHRLVWEAMHDGIAPLAGHPRWMVAITRVVPVEVTAPSTITRLPRVLFAVGSALSDDVIRPGAMFVGLLQALEVRGICVSRVALQVGIDQLHDNCRRLGPDLVHVVAHGMIDADGRGLLHLQGEGGGSWVDADTLATALTAGGPPVTVVVSACRSGAADGPPGARPMAAQLVAHGIPIVSAMAGEIGEQACRLYTRGLAEAIHAGRPVVEAAAEGRRVAVLRAERSDTELDWAMPALFLAESVDPGHRAVDPSTTRDLLGLATELGLRQSPVFIGRHRILRLGEDLVEPDAAQPVGFAAVVAEGSLAGLGGTRLLQEIGYKALREGHLPLLLGPYTETDRPRDLRSLVVRLLEAVAEFAELIRIAPVPLTTLLADRRFNASAVQPDALAALPAEDAHVRVREVLLDFEDRSNPLDVRLVGPRLATDLRRLADAAALVGSPFGAHSRVVVLGDDVHAWIGALEPLLSLVGPSGLGTLARPVPVIVTGSLVQDAGPALRTFRDERLGRAGFAFPELARLSPLEAAMGFQWVLLHPWRPKYPKVYTAARRLTLADVAQYFEPLDGRPSAVFEELYLVVHGAAIAGAFDAQNDERALEEYAARFP
jgi:hypothetical protein